MKILTINVKPQSSRDEVIETSSTEFQVNTTAPAKEGKANKQVIKLLAHHFHTSPSNLVVSKGERWNVKTILLLE